MTYPPDVHRAPSAVPPTVPTVTPAAVIVVFSPEVTASCTAPRTGSDVVLPEDEFSVEVPLDELPGADVTLLKRLEVLISQNAITGDISNEDLMAVAPLFQYQADWISERLVEARARALELAELRANSLLFCVWPNAEQTAECPAGSISPPSVIAAGTVTSPTSQADADQRALNLAIQALVCEWENVEVTATCPGGDVPNDVTPVALSGRLRRGSVTVAAGEVTSSVSQADANARAQALADSQLDCFYINATSDPIGCDNDAPLRPSTEESGQLGYTDRREEPPVVVESVAGNPVVIPTGWAESPTSAADALEIATAAAQALLVCKWTNEETEAPCPDDEDENGDPVESISSGVTIPAGTVESYISEEDLQNQLELLAASLLTCLYCNKAVPAYCTVSPGFGPSIDQTSGIPAGAYCATRYLDAKLLADSVAGIPDAVKVSASSTCRVQSNAVVAVCYQNQTTAAGYTKFFLTAGGAPGDIAKLAPTATKTVYLPAGSITLTGAGTVADATAAAGTMALSLLDCYYQSSTITVKCGAPLTTDFDTTSPITQGTGEGYSPRAIGSTTAIVVNGGTIRSNVSLAAANQEAYNIALGQMDCFFDNLRVEALCGDTLAQFEPIMDSDSGTLLGDGDGKLDGVAVVHEKSVGAPCNPAVVLVGTYTSKLSQEEANRFAVTDGLGRLNCFYYNNNNPSESTCPDSDVPMILLKSGEVTTGRVRSEVSQQDANDQADLLAEALVVCIAEDMVGSGETGAPGPQGNPGNCSTACSAVYS